MKKFHLRILVISLCLLLVLPAFSFLPIAAADTEVLAEPTRIDAHRVAHQSRHFRGRTKIM